jgi:hypothetical protein
MIAPSNGETSQNTATLAAKATTFTVTKATVPDPCSQPQYRHVVRQYAL